MAIIKIEPFYCKKIWGGNKLFDLGFKVNKDQKIGEVWLISAHPNGMSHLKYKGKRYSLKDFYEQNPWFFNNWKGEYPLLNKVIYPEEPLCIQVHPNDQYALEHHNSLGKPESWLVLEAEKNSKVIYGHKSKDIEDFKNSLKNRKWDNLVKYTNVFKDNFIYIPAGKIHALLPGVCVYEVQRSSDITYRLYDYDRVDENGILRQEHHKEVIENTFIPDAEKMIIEDFNSKKFDSEYFSTALINSEVEYKWDFPLSAPWIQLTIVEGEGKINDMTFSRFDSAIISKDEAGINLFGKMKVMISHVNEKIN